MVHRRVGVLRGGPSSEYEVSLRSGGAVLNNLPTDKYSAHDIFIDRAGRWHWSGLPTSPRLAAKQVDVIFNALHGEYGEDGRVQSLLDSVGIPYTGSGTFASALAMKKTLAKELCRRHGLKVPHGVLLTAAGAPARELARQAFARVSPPWVIKPADRGSSVGLALGHRFSDLPAAIDYSRQFSPNVLVEEFINGREATCGVIENFRGSDYYALPVIEIRRPADKAVWDYTDKYSGATEEICPGAFSKVEKQAVGEAAIAAHRALGLRHYSRSDFIVSPRGLYLLEVNTLPGLTNESLLPKALAAVGCSYPDFLDHLLTLALDRR